MVVSSQGAYSVASKSGQDNRFRRLAEHIAVSALGGKYQQFWPLRSCRGFESFLSERDLSFHGGLLPLWDLGILRPIAIACKPEGHEASEGLVPLAGLDDQYWVDVRPLPLALPRRPSDTRASELANEALYHPFQVWQAKLVHDRLAAVRIATSFVLAPVRDYLSTARRARNWNRRSLQHLLAGHALIDSYKLIGVLLGVAPISVPRVTHRIVGGIDEPLEEYWLWRRTHDPDKFLAEHGVKPGDFQRWHAQLAASAGGVDPLAGWFALTQQVELEKRKPLESSAFAPIGPARLAQDLYLMAQVLRAYAKEFLMLDLPEEDVARWGPQATAVNQRLYGSPDVTVGARDVRRRIAREYGLDSGVRIIWFVEGDTEVGFIRTYFAQVGIDPHNRGIELRSLKGIGGLKSNKLDESLNAAQREEQFVFVTVDDEADARAKLRALNSSGLITAGYRLWAGRCFETANFSNGELALIVAEYLHLPGKHRFTGTQLSDARKQAKSIKDAINACLKGSRHTFQTRREWGEHLARWALRHPALDDLQEEGERPIVSDLLMVFRSAHASFAETARRFRVGESGKLEERPQTT
jgi:hypothetical protein